MNNSEIMWVNYPLSQWQVANLGVNPVEIVKAPGHNKYLVPHCMILDFAAGQNAFGPNVAGMLVLSYTGTNDAPMGINNVDTIGDAPFIGPMNQHSYQSISVGSYNDEVLNTGLSVSYTTNLAGTGPVAAINVDPNTGWNAVGNSYVAACVGDQFYIISGNTNCLIQVTEVTLMPMTFVALTSNSLTLAGDWTAVLGGGSVATFLPRPVDGNGQVSGAYASTFDGTNTTWTFNTTTPGTGTISAATSVQLFAASNTIANQNPVVACSIVQPGTGYNAQIQLNIEYAGNEAPNVNYPNGAFTVDVTAVNAVEPVGTGTAVIRLAYSVHDVYCE